MAVGIAGGIGERPSCRSAVPAWPPAGVRGCGGVSLEGTQGSRWESPLPWGGSSLGGTPGSHRNCSSSHQ